LNIDSKNTIRWQSFIAISLGIMVFILVVGPSTLNPTNEHWLLVGNDVMQHYLGWVFFRHSPWSFPIGLNPANGLEFSSSIVFSDSIPLLAFIFKFLSPVLPEPFQYMGIWLLLCFVLQAFFAWKLVALISPSFWIRFFATLLFLFAPILLFRTDMEKPQVAQFFVLAALYLNLNKEMKGRSWWWLTLLFSSLLVNFYIFAMSLGLYFADLLNRTFRTKTINRKSAINQLVVLLLGCAFLLWQAGYFAVDSAGQSGYGFFKLNLLGLFNPLGWSFILPDIAMQSSWAEGYMYLGLGVIIGLILLMPRALVWTKGLTPHAKARPYLCILLIGFTLFAITNQIGIGLMEVSFPLPKLLLKVASVLRASARMFWPVYYFLFLFMIYGLCRTFSRNIAIIILASLALIQSVDLYAGWQKTREATSSLAPAIYSNPLPSPIWNDLVQKYQNIRVVPERDQLNPDNMARFLAHEWKRFGRLASQHGMGTNATYLTRGDQPEKRISVNADLLERIRDGRYVANSLYIIPDRELGRAWCGKLIQPKAALLRIDNYNVLAPNYFDKSIVGSTIQDYSINLSNVKTQLSTPIFMGSSSGATSPNNTEGSAVFCEGWGESESWGTWSNGVQARVFLPLPEQRPKSLTLEFQAFVFDAHPKQLIKLKINTHQEISLTIQKPKNNRVTVPLDSSDWNLGYALVQFEFVNPISPKQAGHSIDDRPLAIGLESVVFNR
jgi:hypothetical protein